MTQTVALPTAAVAPASPASGGPRGLLASEALWGWAGPLLVTLVGGLLRLRHLGRPGQLVFDEVYYVKDAASYLQVGYERTSTTAPSGTPDPFTRGTTDVFSNAPEFVVHPPLGKWMIALGEYLLGVGNPVGWRLTAAVCGTLSILMIGRVAHRLFGGSAALATTASLLLAVDGLHFVHSRTGILDIFVMFWALAAFACLLIDRDRFRARLARTAHRAPDAAIGPWGGLRPWRLAGVVCLGLCTGVKWSGAYVAAAFLIASVLWDVGARRAAGVRRWGWAGTVVDGAQALVSTLVLLPATYLATWTGWLVTSGGYDRQWATANPAAPGWGWVPDALRSLLHYHSEMWTANITLTKPHPYQSNPWSWLVMGRPTAFFYQRHTDGHAGCHVADCAQAVHAIGNPVIWWGALLAAAVLVVRWALLRDHRAGAILLGYAGGYLPWFLYQSRTIYTFYAVAFVPWVVLALTYVLGLVAGPPDVPPRRRRTGVLAAGGVVLAAVCAFWFFYPVLAAPVVPHAAWFTRMWLPGWI